MMLKRNWKLSVLVVSGSLLLLGSSLLMASPQDSTNGWSDNAITTAIEAKLFRDPSLKTQDIHVSTQQGVVTLTGTVNTPEDQSAVDQIASTQPGVVKVIDSLSVNQSAPSSAADVEYSPPAQPADQGQYSSNAAPQAEPVPSTLVLPAGTTLSVRLTQGLSSNVNRPGDGFSAMLEQPVVVDGWVVARRGQTVQGRVVEAKKGGRVKGVSQLQIALTELTFVNGQQMPIHTQLVATSAGHSTGRDVEAAGTTTGIGAMIGAIAGGGEGAGIGAAAGAAAGVAGVLLTHGRPTVIPPETLLTFRIESSVNISTYPGQAAFRPVTQQDYPQHTLQNRPERVVMAPQPGYPPPYYYGYYGWPGYYSPYWYWGPRWGYGGPGFVGIYRFHGDRDGWRGDRREWRGDRGGGRGRGGRR